VREICQRDAANTSSAIMITAGTNPERLAFTGTAFRTGSVVAAPHRKQTIALSAISVPH
jgi:hypothetical protein